MGFEELCLAKNTMRTKIACNATVCVFPLPTCPPSMPCSVSRSLEEAARDPEWPGRQAPYRQLKLKLEVTQPKSTRGKKTKGVDKRQRRARELRVVLVN